MSETKSVKFHTLPIGIDRSVGLAVHPANNIDRMLLFKRPLPPGCTRPGTVSSEIVNGEIHTYIRISSEALEALAKLTTWGVEHEQELNAGTLDVPAG